MLLLIFPFSISIDLFSHSPLEKKKVPSAVLATGETKMNDPTPKLKEMPSFFIQV